MRAFRLHIAGVPRGLGHDLVECAQHEHTDLADDHRHARGVGDAHLAREIGQQRLACPVHRGEQHMTLEGAPIAPTPGLHRTRVAARQRLLQLGTGPRCVERIVRRASARHGGARIPHRLRGTHLVPPAGGAAADEIGRMVAQRVQHARAQRAGTRLHLGEQSALEHDIHEEVLHRLLGALAVEAAQAQPRLAGRAVEAREFAQRRTARVGVAARGVGDERPARGGEGG